MENKIFAPWRMAYILSNSDDNEQKEPGCIFCEFPKMNDDEKNLILHRGKECFVILNAFPYNPGHLMVVPYRHTSDLPGLTAPELSEMMSLCQTSHRVITEVMNPHGFNMGMNLGKVAGAGIDQHLHMHVVPRWNGDTNFMPVLGEVRVISEALNSTWKRLREKWPE
ncbi:MAG: HIT domain-containing protein [Synergistaceae bacterium]|nr:HIT domain-containing protein [Synergistaceae bacterium]